MTPADRVDTLLRLAGCQRLLADAERSGDYMRARELAQREASLRYRLTAGNDADNDD